MQERIKEQVVKTVVKSGNGGAVWVPKNWLGEEVIVILPERQKQGMKERVLQALESHLPDITAIGIYGSYARNEQTNESDIDVLVITHEKRLKLSEKEKGLDIISLPLGALRIAIRKYPVSYYQMVQETEPLVNASIFHELKKILPHKNGLKEYIKETKEHIKSSKEILELDKLYYSDLKSYSVIYSLILRLKGMFIIQCIMKKETFSNKKFKQWILQKGITNQEYKSVYNAYKMVRDETNKKTKIEIVLAEK